MVKNHRLKPKFYFLANHIGKSLYATGGNIKGHFESSIIRPSVARITASLVILTYSVMKERNLSKDKLIYYNFPQCFFFFSWKFCYLASFTPMTSELASTVSPGRKQRRELSSHLDESHLMHRHPLPNPSLEQRWEQPHSWRA